MSKASRLQSGWLSESVIGRTSDTLLLDMPCRLIIGNRGSGKSLGMEPELIDLAKAGEYAVVAFDLPGTLSRRMAGHLSAAGLEDRAEFEWAASKDHKYLSWPFFTQSTAEDPIQRQIENDTALEEFALGFFATANMKATEEKPYTKLWIMNAARLWGSQPIMPPLTWIEKCFFPDTREYAEMIQNAQDTDVLPLFEAVNLRRMRNPVQYETETGASYRKIKNVRSPVLWAHNGTSCDWRTLLSERKQVYFDLSGVPQEMARMLTIFACNAIVATCRRYFNETGNPLPVVIVLEEAGALDLVTPLIITAMQELRKAGVFVWIISQTIMDFQDQAKFEQIMALTDDHVYYRANSGVERIAQDLAAPTFDPLAVHYTRDKLVHNGYEQVETHSKSSGVQKQPLGGSKRISTNESSGTSFLSKYKTVVEEYYKAPQVQAAEWQRAVATLQTFERIVRDQSGVRRERAQPCFEIWPLGMSEMITEEAIQRIRTRPHYQACQLPSTPKAGKGMRKS